jgi:hypothetical protein
MTLRGGGSGLPQQLARQFAMPDWAAETRLWQKVVRKFTEIGAACSLYVAFGGPEGVLRAYADYAPVAAGGGTTRGLAAGAATWFGVSPAQLSLAAAPKRPLRRLPDRPVAGGCAAADPDPAWRAQCRVIHRARHAAPLVLQGERLHRALAELDHLARVGLRPANPFHAVPARRLINLTERLAATLSPGVWSQLVREMEAAALAPAEPLVLALDARQQTLFTRDLATAFAAIDQTSAARSALCVPLARPAVASQPRCGNSEPDAADVFAATMDARSGEVQRIHQSGALMHATASVVIVAAVAAGLGPDTSVCPRAASNGTRPLRRVERPREGFADCDGGRHLMTLAQAMARSDSLAFYDLARSLGDQRLRTAAQSLGLPVDAAEPNVAYALAFGTHGATPHDLLRAGQALFALAFELEAVGMGPRLLSVATDGVPAYRSLARLLPQASQRRALRLLLEAPVTQPGGTLGHMAGTLSAGKTGSLQSVRLDHDGESFAAGRLALTFHADSVSLLIVSTHPARALAKHWLPLSLLKPAHLVLVNGGR